MKTLNIVWYVIAPTRSPDRVQIKGELNLTNLKTAEVSTHLESRQQYSRGLTGRAVLPNTLVRNWHSDGFIK